MTSQYLQYASRSNAAQRGAILVISLLFLLVLTMIGVASMQTTTLEEKMAGNMRDRSVALQAAESGTRDAEVFIESVATTAAFADSNGLYGEYSTITPDPFAAATWTSNATSRAGTALGGIAAAPRYFIRYTGTPKSEVNPETCGYGSCAGGDISTFEITARGTGIAGGDTAATEAMVRTFYGRRF